MAYNDDNDLNLFRKTMEADGVRRNKYHANNAIPNKTIVDRNHPDIGHSKPPRSTIPGQPMIDKTHGEPGVLFARHGVQKTMLKKLRQGAITIDESMDLHGLRSHEAEKVLNTFLAESIEYGYSCIQIIHGKGLGSEQTGGVLKPLTIYWLKQQPEVLAFCSSLPRDGGSGATCVLLKPIS